MDYPTILNALLTIILALYGDSSLPRNIVDRVIDSFHDFIKCTFLVSLEKDILIAIEKSFPKPLSADNIAIINEMKIRIHGCIRQHHDIFQDVSSESKRFNLLRKTGFVEPIEFKLRRKWENKIVDDESVYVQEDSFGVYVPLKHSLELFLEMPGMFNKIYNYVQHLSKNTSVITNVMQGKLWLQKYALKYKDEIFFPIFQYYDEIEVKNPLGSHAGVNKFGAVYFSIACLPPDVASRLNSIFFSTLIYAEDLKKCTNEEVFRRLIDELNFLAKTGITILVEGVQKVIKFQLILILGDNLGSNQICGFIDSFKSDYWCRFCEFTAKEAASMTAEIKARFRDRKNYKEDLKLGNESLTGIEESYVFNKVFGFFITENKCLDMMHDVFEGVCMYVVGKLLYTFIYVKGYFTEAWLNSKLRELDFGNKSNSPPKIKTNRIKRKMHLKMSAAEMYIFVKYLGVLIGEKIPRSDEHWKLYKSLRKVVDIMMSPRVDAGLLRELRDEVETVCNLYLIFYGNLKPKFHNLLHYARLMAWLGPCKNFWCMPFESRHRHLKLQPVLKINLRQLQSNKSLECVK